MKLHFTSATQDEVFHLVRDFHYSRRMPANIQHIYVARKGGGLFGDFGEPLAAVVFSIPPTRWAESVIELSRLVRCPTTDITLSSLISFACDCLKKNGHDLIVSFADWTQRHHGGVYQAAGWNYAGARERRMDGVLLEGKFIPGRSANSKWGTRSPTKLAKRGILVEPHYDDGKYLYWRALSVRGKTKAKRLCLKSLPYPKPKYATRLLDAPLPGGESNVQTVGVAP